MLVEGKTRYAVLLRNNDLKSKPLMNRRIHQISALPAEARRSMPFTAAWNSWPGHGAWATGIAWFYDRRRLKWAWSRP